MDSRDRHLKMLVESLRLLASPASVQLNSLPEAVVKADELALIFCDCTRFLPELRENQLVSESFAEQAGEIDEMLAGLSGRQNSSFWTDESVRTSVKWQEVREMAASTLSEAGCKEQDPYLFWLQFVPGKE